MLRSIAILMASSASYLVVAHPHCHYDLREVDLDGELTFCSMDYAPNGICCTEAEEAELEETINAAGPLTEECGDYYYQMICGVCGSFSGHLYERLALALGLESGLTMKTDFCEALTSACAGQIDFPDYDGVGFCTMHTGGGSEDLFWSYPYEERGAFTGDYTLMFPDLPELPSKTVAMHQSPDGSMFWIAGKDGQLVRVDADSMSSSTTVMDLSGGIFLSSFEEGLLDFAFSPLFDDNDIFYVSWTVNEPFDRNRLSKFQYFEGDPDATRESEELLVQSAERARFLHNGGWLGFKPSDYGKAADYHDLYWAIGDSGPQEDPFDNGQRTDTHFGSVVRISVPSAGTGYEVPDGNYPGAELPEICAIGFRNNWRCGFDRLTDDLYCGDVGHVNIESIKLIECGNNYGWVRFEGSRCTEYSEDDYGPCADADRSDLTLPFFEYCHDSYDSSGSSEDAYTNGVDICGDRSIIGSAVMGGYVYRGQAYQDVLYGAYIFGDHQTGDIFFVREEGGSKTAGPVVTGGVKIFSFAEDNSGELYVIGEDNNIYILPCGEPCDDAPIGIPPPETTDDDDSTPTEITDDDDSTPTEITDDDDSTPTTETTDDDNSTPTTETTDDDNSTPTETTDDDDSTPTEIPDDDDRTNTYEYIGCYGDNNKQRVLTGMVLDHFDEMTTEMCAGFCMGSAYFATQYAIQCFCGVATDDPTILGPANCGSPCGGDSTQICGGTDALSVYEYLM